MIENLIKVLKNPNFLLEDIVEDIATHETEYLTIVNQNVIIFIYKDGTWDYEEREVK